MLEIHDGNGKVISRSQNLRGIRRYLSSHIPESVFIWEVKRIVNDKSGKESLGTLDINFQDGSGFSCEWNSFAVLCRVLRYWRNLYGTPLWIDGKHYGVISCHNRKLVSRSC
jgi:hypothetical protein